MVESQPRDLIHPPGEFRTGHPSRVPDHPVGTSVRWQVTSGAVRELM